MKWLCRICGEEISEGDNLYCDNCIQDKKEIAELIKQGHTRHCACRIVWGDGECTCNQTGEMIEEQFNKLVETIKKNMKQQKIGIYRVGSEQVELFIREGMSGDFYFIPEKGKLSMIKVGANYEHWYEVLAVLLHEIGEFVRFKAHCRYIEDNNYSNSPGNYFFFYNHSQYSDICMKEAMFLDEAINDLKKAWKNWK